MATITYGKGKILRPTPLAALRETLGQNARKGRVEMLDVPARRANISMVDADNRLRSGHADVRAANNALTPIRQGGESSASSKGAGERKRKDDPVEKIKAVRVRIHAPNVVHFFTPKKHEEVVVLTEEHLRE
jgi:hypothetical protein